MRQSAFTSVVVALVALSTVVGGAAAQAGPVAPLEVRSRGNPRAPITVFELSDFQCPWCRRFTLETLPHLEREYISTGKVRLVFVNFPLTQIHRNAAAAHETAMCAARQGKFWPMHDLLFRRQEEWAPLTQPAPALLSYADSIGADREALGQCLRTAATRLEVEADARSAARTGATSTPTFLIEGGFMDGFSAIEVWRPILDSILRGKERGAR